MGTSVRDHDVGREGDAHAFGDEGVDEAAAQLAGHAGQPNLYGQPLDDRTVTVLPLSARRILMAALLLLLLVSTRLPFGWSGYAGSAVETRQ